MKTTNIVDVLKAGSSDWNNWKWQMQYKAICSNTDQLVAIGLLDSNFEPRRRRIGLTPYNVKLLLSLKDSDPEGYRAESLQSILPTSSKDSEHQWVWAKRHDLASSKIWERLPIPAFLKILFTGKGSDTETQALENMYPNTDIIIATATCARHCSFCFREVGDAHGEASQITGDLEEVQMAVKEAIERKTPHILVTGGDPLTRNNKQLREILEPLVKSETVQVLRLATRLVVDLPMRFYDTELLEMFREFASRMKSRNASFRIVTHVNHPCELASEAIRAIKNIQSSGVDIMDQTVVLRGVNDKPEILSRLLMTLDRLGIRNHKLFHAMPVAGTEHLRIPMRRFRKLLSTLHQFLPGTSVPQANAPTLVGKMPITPSGRWMLSIPFTNRIICRSFRGEWYLFRDTWDIRRHLKEVGIALTLALSLTILAQAPRVKPQFTKIVVLPNALLDEWFIRKNFEPFVSGDALVIPQTMIE
ncbi:radical SAM protein [Candidatus Giovannonibacteria bacterium]|nr:radical SAM protein [Candidatus Giovannonibacteria bacterium]